jgi:DNA repair exonuclease SbcCD ATPase subunit
MYAQDRQRFQETAKEVIRQIGAECQETAQAQINTVVTRCLQAVFGSESYQFRLVFELKRGQTEARAVLIDAQGNELDPVQSVGGGILDVVTFGLRLACLALMRPRPAQVLILDEPFRFLSEQYRENVKRLMVELSEELGIQIILVTHISEFMDVGHLITVV